MPQRLPADSQGQASSDGLQLTKIEAPQPMSGEVARKLLARLLSGGVQVGQRLPSERELASQLGVGRSAIREGLKPLVLLGVLEVRPGSGTYLRGATSDLLPDVIDWGLLLGSDVIEDMIEARVLLEVLLVRLVAERRDESLMLQLERALEAMRSAGTVEQFTQADLAFHMTIADGSRNTVLAGVLRNIRALLAVWIRRVRESQTSDVLYQQHVLIGEAIQRGDADAAVAAMQDHMDSVTTSLRGALLERKDPS